MKKLITSLLAIIISLVSNSQTDFSGHYGFQMKVYMNKDSDRKPGKEEEAVGRTGDLTLFKIDSHTYKFWLSVNRGWPSYNEGDIDGFIEIVNNKAAYTKKLEYADSACHINFHLYPNYIQVEQKSGDIECGFGMNVFANGKYNKKDSHKLTNAGLAKQYIESNKYKVTVGKAFLFEDETGQKMKKQYFTIGTIVLGIEENDNFIYTEYISPQRKLIYGWLKKSEVKPVKTK